MGPIVCAVRDALCDAINNPTAPNSIYFGPVNTIVAVWDWYVPLTTLAAGSGIILAMPASKNDEKISRGSQQHQSIKIDVAVLYKLKATDPASILAEADPYMTGLEGIESFFLPGGGNQIQLKTTNGQIATCESAEWPSLHNPELIRSDRTFQSTLRLEFVVVQ